MSTVEAEKPPYRIFGHLPRVQSEFLNAGGTPKAFDELLEAVRSNPGVCTCSVVEWPHSSAWLMAFLLDEGIRLILVQGPSNAFLGGLHYDLETEIYTRQQAGEAPTKRDVVRAMLSIIFGDDADDEFAAMEKRGDL